MFSKNFIAQCWGNIPPSLVRRARPIVVCGTLTMLALAIHAPTPAQASWCALYKTGGTNCYFTSHAQCQASVSGIGGFCNEVSDGKSKAESPPERTRKVIAKPKRDPEPKSQAAPRQLKPTPAVAAPVVAPIPAAPRPAPTDASAPAAPQMDNAFVQARQLILGGQYDAGIAAMRALKFDDHPEIATFIGLAYRKLGRSDEAKSWYERALAADPNHKLALSYYGMMRVEQGDIPGAQADLVRIGQLCGDTNCNEYQALQGVIAARIR